MLTWLADCLRSAGLAVREIPGWTARGHGDMAEVLGVLCHHTAGPASGDGRLGALTVPGYPSLAVVVNGRTDLPGPLANLGLARDGTWITISAGQAWHAGTGSVSWCPTNQGNSHLIGIEAESTGRLDSSGKADWTLAQQASYARGVAALLAYLRLPAARAIGHKEWAPGRKIDPVGIDMTGFRTDVARWITHPDPSPASSPEDPVISYAWPAGVGAHKLVCPVGKASAVTAAAWLSLACDGVISHYDIWFQADQGGISEVHGALDKDRRGNWQIPDGTTQITVHYVSTGPVGAAIEVRAK